MRVLVVIDLGNAESSAVGHVYADAAQQAAAATGELPHSAAYVLSGAEADKVLEAMLGPADRRRRDPA